MMRVFLVSLQQQTKVMTNRSFSAPSSSSQSMIKRFWFSFLSLPPQATVENLRRGIGQKSPSTTIVGTYKIEAMRRAALKRFLWTKAHGLNHDLSHPPQLLSLPQPRKQSGGFCHRRMLVDNNGRTTSMGIAWSLLVSTVPTRTGRFTPRTFSSLFQGISANAATPVALWFSTKTSDPANLGEETASGTDGFEIPEKTIPIVFVDTDGRETVVSAKVGDHLLKVANDNNFELEGACGGEMACSTCHLIFEESFYSALPPKSAEEDDMLDLAFEVTETSRLGCQIRVKEEYAGMKVRIPNDGFN